MLIINSFVLNWNVVENSRRKTSTIITLYLKNITRVEEIGDGVKVIYTRIEPNNSPRVVKTLPYVKNNK